MLAALMDKMLKSARPDDTPAQPAKGWFHSLSCVNIRAHRLYLCELVFISRLACRIKVINPSIRNWGQRLPHSHRAQSRVKAFRYRAGGRRGSNNSPHAPKSATNQHSPSRGNLALSQKGKQIMRIRGWNSIISRLIHAIVTFWLCCAGSAWAGDGANGVLSPNTSLRELCDFLESFGVPLPSCPQVPSLTQSFLQLAAWELVPTEMLRATNGGIGVGGVLGGAVDAGNPSLPPALIPTTPVTTAITAFPVTGPALSNLLPNLTPLAFISSVNQGTAAATQLYNRAANMFLYAVASGFLDHGRQPDTLFLFYEDTSRTNANLIQGQTVAQISLPLTVLNKDGTERLAMTMLQFGATNAGDCLASTVAGDFSGLGTPQTLTPAQIGVDCAVVFAPSPISAKAHAIFEVQVPLVVTNATDPLYFFNPIANIGGPFSTDVIPPPSTPPVLGVNGKSIGIAPSAVPLCTPTTCPSQNPPAPVFALCANLPGGNGNGQVPVHAVAAYFALATTGETLLSAALPAASTSVCPF